VLKVGVFDKHPIDAFVATSKIINSGYYEAIIYANERVGSLFPKMGERARVYFELHAALIV